MSDGTMSNQNPCDYLELMCESARLAGQPAAKTPDFSHDVKYFAMRVLAEPEGTIPLYGTDLRRKYLVAITNQTVDRKDVYAGVQRICDFAQAYARHNFHLSPSLCIGWWRNPLSLFIDLTLMIEDRSHAIAMGQVFRQQAIGFIDESLAYHEITLPRRAA